MAIKYYNITDTSDNHLETLKGVLESVAADYFTSFELSEDKFTLTCYDGENPLLVFTMATGCKSFKATINGMSGISANNSATTATTVCTRVATTSCGVVVKFKVNGTDIGYGLFITKSKNGKTAVLLEPDMFTTSTSTTGAYCFTSETSIASKISIINRSASTRPDITDQTSISNILVSGTIDNCPNLYVMVNSQFYGRKLPIDIDGVKYLSNGYYILKDE